MQLMKRYPFLLLLPISSLNAQWSLVDDMENENNWTGEGILAADPDSVANQVYRIENVGDRLVTYLPLTTPISEGGTATLFFRIRTSANNDQTDWVVGASAVAAPSNWPDFEGYVRISDGGTAGDIDLDVRDGGGFAEVGSAEPDTWTNVWLILDNGADTTDIYYNTVTADATSPGSLSLTGAAFRNGTTTDLITLLAINNEVNTTTFIDDIYLDLSGVNLTHPLGTDEDNDEMPDDWEIAIFGDTSRDGTGDFDSDTLTDLAEYEGGTDPTLKDTDGDTLDDNIELAGTANPFDNEPTNPTLADSDDDGFDDAEEGVAASNPNDPFSIPARPDGFLLVENFEGEGMIVGETFNDINGWTAPLPEALSVSTLEGSSDQVGRVERLPDTNVVNAISKNLDDLGYQILEGDTGTLFFQVLASSTEVDNSFGLSDVAAPAGYSDFEAQTVLYPGGNLRARDAEVFRDQALFAPNTWMNVWIVADNENDLVNIHVESPDGQTGKIEITDDGDIDPFNFRNGTTNRLTSILIMTALAAEAGSFVLIDNIYIDPSTENLSKPVPSKQAFGSSELAITSIVLNSSGDLSITFNPNGENYILTASNDLSAPFEQVLDVDFNNLDTFTIPADELSAKQRFYRVEVSSE